MPLDHKRHQISQLARYTLPCSGLSPRWGARLFSAVCGDRATCRCGWAAHQLQSHL